MPSDGILIATQTPEEKLAFEKARFDYCVTIHEIEDKSRKNLESKSQFYLSFITLFLGAVFFNIEFLDKLGNLVVGKAISATLITGIYACAIILAVSLLVSLISILASAQLKSYKAVYPENVTQMLFGPNSDYIEKKDLTSLYRTISMNYTIALEYNKKINDRKATWAQVAALSVFASVMFTAILLALFTYMMLL
jgi:hypothetical protein